MSCLALAVLVQMVYRTVNCLFVTILSKNNFLPGSDAVQPLLFLYFMFIVQSIQSIY